MCDPLPTFEHYSTGALSFPNAIRLPAFTIDQFPADHLRDMFDSVGVADRHDGAGEHVIDGFVLVVTRERGEHLNLFHSATDWFNAFMAMVVLDLPPSTTSVLIMDSHPQSPLDIVWDAAFSRSRRTMRIRQSPDRMLIQNAVFVPPGYSSFFYRHNTDPDDDCQVGTGGVALYDAFSRHILSGFGVTRRQARTSSVRVLMVVRKPYLPSHPRMGRQIDNEAALVSALDSIPGIVVDVVDFAGLDFEEQLRRVSASDVMIGMHGAGLTHALWLPVGGALLEIRPKPSMGWYCFRHMAKYAGLHYDALVNRHFPAGYREDAHGDYTTVDVAELTSIVESLLSRVRSSPAR